MDFLTVFLDATVSLFSAIVDAVVGYEFILGFLFGQFV